MKKRDRDLVKKYPSPIPEGVTTKVMYPTGKKAHEKFPESRYDKDFIAAEGTPIIAMESGKVIYVQSDSNQCGLDERYANKANMIVVRHKDGSMLDYIHFGQDQIYFKKGDKVKEGQILGLSGLSGYMLTPHVHVGRFKIERGKIISLPYDVEGLEDPRATDKSSHPKKGRLEGLVGVIFIISITIALLFFSGITGNIIGITNNNLYGSISILVGLVCGGIWIFLKKR